MKTVLIIAIVAVIVIVALLAMRDGRPRITHIERRTDGDEKDRDDA